MECHFAAVNFCIHFFLIRKMDVQNFPPDDFSRKFLPHEYRENKLLAKLNRFTVNCIKRSAQIVSYMRNTVLMRASLLYKTGSCHEKRVLSIVQIINPSC